MLMQLVAAAGVLGLLTVVPGPDMAVVTKRAVAAGSADGLRTVGGIAIGLLAWGTLTVTGLAAVLAASPAAYMTVKLLGAAYLVLLGGQSLWQHRRGGQRNAVGPNAAADARAVGNPWRTGLVSNILNPKIAVFYTSLLPALVPAGMPTVPAMVLLVLIHTGLTLAWLSSYVFLLSRARAVVEEPRMRRALGRITGVVLIGCGVAAAVVSG